MNLESAKRYVSENKWLQFLLVGLAGVAIGALFYPTKRIEESLTKKHQEEIRLLNEKHEKSLEQSQELYLETAAKFKSYYDESEKKITSLTTQVTTLKSKQKTAYYKVVRPDGTIEIKKYSESEVDESTKVISQIQEEFKQKVESIEQKWSSIHKERIVEIEKEYSQREQAYKKEIQELKQTKVVEINQKKFGIEAGILFDRTPYGHVTYDLFGPVFVGAHAQFGNNNVGGLGLGLRF